MNVLKRLIKKILPETVLIHLQAADHYFNGEGEIKIIGQLCPAQCLAIDAGANIGTYSYFLRKHARHVVAYEPNPLLARRLAQVLPDITIRNLAVSDKAGQVVLQVPIDSAGTPQHELASIAQDFDGRTTDFPVAAITIDSEKFEGLGFIKIDVEQHEREVLRGALATIARCRPVIMTEVSPLKYSDELPLVFKFITDINYRGWFRLNKEWLPLNTYSGRLHAAPENFGNAQKFIGGNILFFPAEHALAERGPRV